MSRFGELEKLSVAEMLEWLDSEEGVLPAPHSQRSRADVRAEVAPTGSTPAQLELIDLVEGALGTPVQATVKRIDEQEFARLNGANPLFCEDAARRIASALAADSRIRAYRVRVHHLESLHAHDAVASVTSATWAAPGVAEAAATNREEAMARGPEAARALAPRSLVSLSIPDHRELAPGTLVSVEEGLRCRSYRSAPARFESPSVTTSFSIVPVNRNGTS